LIAVLFQIASLWLTSFVVKVFGQASKHVDDVIDSNNVRESVEFIQNHQQRDGCFKNSGFVLHNDLRGTDLSVTASTLVTLLEVRHLAPTEEETVGS